VQFAVLWAANRRLIPHGEAKAQLSGSEPAVTKGANTIALKARELYGTADAC
jgi:hypothetical protein